MHCSVKHWQEIDDKNWVAAAGWLLTIARGGDEEFRKVARSMVQGERPVEQAALVVMGAAYPKDRQFRNFLKKYIFGPYDGDFVSAAIYGIWAHLDFDDDLRDKLLVQQLKWKAGRIEFAKPIDAVSEVFFIWDSSAGSGICLSCGPTRGSLLTPRQPG